jgi:uncharacterized membrane protein
MLELVHAAVTWMLVGLIWTIQIIHYPLLPDVGGEQFDRYHGRHMFRASLLIVPLALTEGALSAALLVFGHRHDPFAWLGLLLVAIIAVSTMTIHGPLHLRLRGAPDERLMRRLIATNWIRTIAWSVRGVLALIILARSRT